MTALKTILFSILVPGTVAILGPYWLLAAGFVRVDVGLFRYAGPPVVLFGVALYVWCAWHFTFTGKGTPAPIDPPKELVVKGPYRWVRNPMYVAVVAVVFGEALFFEARAVFLYAAVVFVAFNLVVFLYEEPVLRQHFGDAYRQYCADVPRWIPWKRLFRGKDIAD